MAFLDSIRTLFGLRVREPTGAESATLSHGSDPDDVELEQIHPGSAPKLRHITIGPANFSTSMASEAWWMDGHFSNLVVGESFRSAEFADVFGPRVWKPGQRRTARRIFMPVAVTFRRDHGNVMSEDDNAIAAWIEDWQVGFLPHRLSQIVSPIMESNQFNEWRSPGVISGLVSISKPSFAVHVQAGLLLTPGPLLQPHLRGKEIFGAPSARQIEFLVDLIDECRRPATKLHEALSFVGLSPGVKWKDPGSYQSIDRIQVSGAIEAIKRLAER